MKQETCTRCREKIKQNRVKWLELSNTDGNYYTPESFPKNHISQGAFPFGTTCATTELNSTIKNIKR